MEAANLPVLSSSGLRESLTPNVSQKLFVWLMVSNNDAKTEGKLLRVAKWTGG